MGEEDLPWIYELCKERYKVKYDWVSCEGWFKNVVLKQPVLFHPVRLPNAFCITMLSVAPWTPSELEANVVLIVAADGFMWEAMKLLRESIDWAQSRKCAVWRLSSDTDVDFKGIAHRLGAEEISPRYCIRF